MEDALREQSAVEKFTKQIEPMPVKKESELTPVAISLNEIPETAINRTITFIDDRNRRSTGQLIQINNESIRIRYTLKSGVVDWDTARASIKSIVFSNDKHQMKKSR
ncbi:MAG: hypothetical protein V3W04_06720 [Gammaproteobacteria bacterium]